MAPAPQSSFFSMSAATKKTRTGRYLALLRGINVGGKNVIRKDDLRGCFEDLGYENVLTYIQSGNILFRAKKSPVRELIAEVEQALAERFNYDARAVIIPREKFAKMQAAVPETWGSNKTHKHNAMFTLAGVAANRIVSQLQPAKSAWETITAAPGIIFWSASIKHLTRTSMMKLAATPAYRQLTVRNHNTFYKLAELFEQN